MKSCDGSKSWKISSLLPDRRDTFNVIHINFNFFSFTFMIIFLLFNSRRAYKTVSISAISVLYVHRYKSCALPPKLRLPKM